MTEYISSQESDSGTTFSSLLIGQGFDIIVVDPPWPLQKLTRKKRPNQHGFDYQTMTVKDIASLPVGSLANDTSWLFLWTTQKYLFDSKPILEAWGFTHLLTMVWKKEYGKSSGMPLYGFSWNGEFILVGYKTKPSLWPTRPLIPAVFSAVNRGHSVKPDEFYKMVEPLGNSRIDLFARQQRSGWTVWGNEVDCQPLEALTPFWQSSSAQA